MSITEKLFSSATGVAAFKKIKDSNRFGKKNEVSATHKLATIGLTKDEATLLSSMLSIVAIKTSEQWELSGIDDAKIFFVNIDSNEGANFLSRYGNRFPIIQYTQKAYSNNMFCLVKPLRARHLMMALHSFSVPSAEGSARLRSEHSNMGLVING